MAADLLLLIKLKDEASHGLQQFNNALKGSKSQLDAMTNAAKTLGITIGGLGAAITGAAMLSVKAFASMGEEIYNLSITTGMSVEALSGLKYIAESAGASIGAVQVAVRQMANALDMAKQGSAEATRALSELGFRVSDFKGMSPDQTFFTLASAVASVEDPLKRSAVAQDLFGLGARQLMPIFAQGADGINKMMLEAEKLGLVMSTDSVNAANAMDDSFDKLKGSVQGLTYAIGEALIPLIKPFIEFASSAVTAIKDWISANETLAKVVVGLGFVLVGAGGLLVAFSMIVKAVQAVTAALAILQAFMGPAGWANLAAGIALAAAATFALYEVTKDTNEQLDQMQQMGASFDFSGAPAGGAVPRFAAGGIVTRPTLALVGESGPEAIVPLSGGGSVRSGVTVNITIQGSVVSERDLVETVRQGLIRAGRANVSALGGFA